MNPADLYFYHDNRIDGSVLGSDGSGIIEQVGEGVSADFIGKKVAVFGDAYA